jgi:protocatechuate 3,4-dioxygenase beta subunit
VTYHPDRVTTGSMLLALEEAREEATFVLAFGSGDADYVRAIESAQTDRPPRLSSSERIAPAGEPGRPLLVRGRLFDEDGRTPVGQAVVFAYHTDPEGRYDRSGSPPHSWRLRGWVQTDAEGRFTFRTIRPGPYPTGRNPAHIHWTVFTRHGRYHAGELLFDDDSLVGAEERAASKRAGTFGAVRPVGREGPIELVDLDIRLDPEGRF